MPVAGGTKRSRRRDHGGSDRRAPLHAQAVDLRAGQAITPSNRCRLMLSQQIGQAVRVARLLLPRESLGRIAGNFRRLLQSLNLKQRLVRNIGTNSREQQQDGQATPHGSATKKTVTQQS